MLLLINNSGTEFWNNSETVKPSLSDKVKSCEKITLVEGEEIINENEENAEILNTVFSNAVKNLKILEYQETDSLTKNISHPIFKTILKHRNHPSTAAIKNLNKVSRFDFCRVSAQDVVEQIKKLSTQKAQYTDLPVKILKENSDIFGNYICYFFNDCVKRGDFPSILKIPNITPVFKKVDGDLKDDYHPLNILPVISKII